MRVMVRRGERSESDGVRVVEMIRVTTARRVYDLDGGVH
jgi:hypothetical protein